MFSSHPSSLIQFYPYTYPVHSYPSYPSSLIQVHDWDAAHGLAALHNVVLAAYARAGASDEAWGIFHHMRNYVCSPDAHTMTTMIALSGSTGQPERAMSLFDEMETIKDIAGNGGLTEIRPTAATYNAVIRACGRSWRYNAMAVDYFHRMPSDGVAPDAQTYHILIDSCSLLGDVPRAHRVMAAMKQAGHSWSRTTYATLLNCYARAQRPRDAAPDRWAPKAPTKDRQQELAESMWNLNDVPSNASLADDLMGRQATMAELMAMEVCVCALVLCDDSISLFAVLPTWP